MGLDKGSAVEELGARILAAAMKVHSALDAGLLESAYEACLAYELGKSGVPFERQRVLPITYDGQRLDAGYRLDLLVDERVVVEVKAVEKLLPIHVAQVLSCLKLGGFPLGYLLNFHVAHMRQGIRRVVA